jgi:hypothetical protein
LLNLTPSTNPKDFNLTVFITKMILTSLKSNKILSLDPKSFFSSLEKKLNKLLKAPIRILEKKRKNIQVIMKT